MISKLRSIRIEPKTRRLQSGLENLFLFLMAVYLAYRCRSPLMFRPQLSEAFVGNLMLAMVLVVLARLILADHRGPGLWLGLILVWACVETYYGNGKDALLFLAILVMGLNGIDYRRVLRAYLASVGAMLLAAVLAGLAGGIPNLVYYQRDSLRSCWGGAYPTDITSLVFFLTIMAWVAWPRLPDWGMLAFGLVPLALALFVTGSRNGLLCGAVFELVVACHWLEEITSRRGKGLRWLRRAMDGAATLALPLCAMLIYLMVFLYTRNPEGMASFDLRVFSERLSLSAEGFRNYAVLPFGQNIAMRGGWGGTVFWKADSYFFLDSSYVQMLLGYGWVTTLLLGVTWVWTTRRAVRAENRRMAWVMGIVALHSLMEHHFMDVFDNILLAMPLVCLSTEPAPRSEGDMKKRYIGFGAVIGACVALAALFLPRVMTWLRTVFDARGWHDGVENALPVLGLSLALVAAVAAGAWGAYRLLAARLERRKIDWRMPAAALGLCLALSAGAGIWGNAVIAASARDGAALVEADADALTRLADFEICTDVLPQVYRQRFGNIRPTVLGGDDLARYPGKTVLTTAWPERRLFINCGFKYIPISDAHAIYSADPAVVAALAEGGYAASDYYDAITHLDLKALAELNGLSMTERGLLLDGTDQSLTKGLKHDLYNGHYVVEYHLFLPEGAMDQKGTVCELRIGPSKNEIMASVPVTRDQFDDAGQAVITIPLGLANDTAHMDFKVYAKKNKQVGVSDISYRQVKL